MIKIEELAVERKTRVNEKLAVWFKTGYKKEVQLFGLNQAKSRAVWFKTSSKKGRGPVHLDRR